MNPVHSLCTQSGPRGIAPLLHPSCTPFAPLLHPVCTPSLLLDNVVVRKDCLYYPNSRGFFGLKTRQNSQIFNPLNLSPVMSPLCHRKRRTPTSAFFVSCVKCAAWASKFARFPRKTCSRCSPCSEIRFLPRKTCEFQPAELVTAEVTGL